MHPAPCARCNLPVSDHTSGGTCPDGGGSFTWALPPPDQLLRALQHIKDAGIRAGRPFEHVDDVIKKVVDRIGTKPALEE